MDLSDDEVFVGPVTFKEMKWQLTKPNYNPSTERRHSIHKIPCIIAQSNESELPDLSVITLDSDSEEEVNLHEDSVIVISDEEDTKPISSEGDKGIICDEFHFGIPTIKIEPPKQVTPKKTQEDSANYIYSKEQDEENIDGEQDKSMVLMESVCEEMLQTVHSEDKVCENEHKTLSAKKKPKKPKDKFDYIVSSVKLYRQLPLGKTITPKQKAKIENKTPKTLFRSPKTPCVNSTKRTKNSYNYLISPVAAHIKNSPTVPLIKKIYASPINKPTTIPTGTLPKVVYKPSKHQIVANKESEFRLPKSAKKVEPEAAVQIIHKNRYKRRSSLPDLSTLLQNDELSLMSAADNCSILSINNVYRK